MYRVVRLGAGYDLLILEDLDDARRGRDDRFWVFDRDRLLHDIRHRMDRADFGETLRVFMRIGEDDLSPYLVGLAGGLGFTDPPEDDFATVMAAWRWLRLKQAECADVDANYYAERLQNAPGNKFFRQMLREQQAKAETIRKRFP